MNLKRQKKNLEYALTEDVHRVKLVHSKHHGWLAIGLMAAIGFGGLAIGFSNPTSVSAATIATTETQRTWSVRPVSEIQAQISASDKQVYDIKWGDTLSTIAEALNNLDITTSVSRLAEINKINNVDLIYAGNKLYLSGSGSNATITTKNDQGQYYSYQLNPAQPVNPQTAPMANQSGKQTDSSVVVTPNKPASGQSVAEIKAQKEADEKAKAELEAQLAKEKAAKEAAEAELTNTLNAENEASASELQAKRTAVLDSIAKAKAKLAAMQTAVDAADNAVKVAQTASDNAAMAVDDKQAQVTSAQSKVDATNAQITEVKAKLADLSAQADVENDATAKQQLVELNAQLATATKNLTLYSATLSAANEQVKAASTTANETAANLTAAKAKQAAAVVARDDANDKLVIANNQLAMVPDAIQANNSEMAKSIKAQLAAIDAQIAKLNQQIKDLDQAIANWDAQLAQVVDDAKAVEAKADTNADSVKAVDVTDSDNVVVNVGDVIKDVEQNVPTIHHTPVTTHVDKVVNVDENGQTITPSADYKLLSSSAKDNSVTADNGDVTITTTTTNVYHKIVDHKQTVVITKDEAGNVITDTTGYVLVGTVNSDPVVTTADNGDTTTKVTVTKTYHLIVATDKQVTVLQDEAGNVVTDLAGYRLVETKPVVKSTETAANGDIVNVYTTVKVYHKLVTNHVNKVVNVDEDGQVITPSADYKLLSSNAKDESVTADNGDVTVTTTTTNVYHRRQIIKNAVTVNQTEDGQVITGEIDPAVYHYFADRDKTEDVKTEAANGDLTITTTTTKTYHLIKTTTVDGRIQNLTIDGEPLTDTTGYELIDFYTQKFPTTTVAANGDITITVDKNQFWELEKTDPVLRALPDSDDSTVVAIESTINAGGRPTYEQDRQVTNAEITKAVAEKFNALVNEEQAATGHTQTQLAHDSDTHAWDMAMQRSVEAMTILDHNQFSHNNEGAVAGDMWLQSENLSYSDILKLPINSKQELIDAVVQAMFEQYIVNERGDDPSKQHGHYQNIIELNDTHLVVGVYIVDASDRYLVTTSVLTGLYY